MKIKMKNKEMKGYEGGISHGYIKKEMLKGIILFGLIIAGTTFFVIFILSMIAISDYGITVPFEMTLMLILFVGVIPFIVAQILNITYISAYVRNFLYEIQDDNIIIHHGVLTKTRATIPYSRIQNINIVNGVFDRMFKTYTVKIETAGSSSAAASAQKGRVRPEGYIPGLKNPQVIEDKINEMVTKYSAIPSGLEDKIFKPEELAFDNFISYILSKMRVGDKLETSIKGLREQANLSAAQLAEKVEVPIQTIQYLEEGSYDPSLALAYKVAKVLGKKIEDLFKL